MKRSEILDEADRWLFPLIIMVSIYVSFRGHNAPGGGFAGGLIAGCAFVLRFLAGGALQVRRVDIARPDVLIGAGLLLAVSTALSPVVLGDALLESTIWKPEVPLIGEVKVVSSAFFDLGVYFLVIGVVLAVLLALGAEPTDPPHHAADGLIPGPVPEREAL
jgi:multicomponent Na+:H+ antiporter subunit B